MKCSKVFFSLLAAGVALANPAFAGTNDPYGTELACVAALKGPFYSGAALQQPRPRQHVTASELPVSELETKSPTFTLETLSADKKSTHLRFFTEAGEFEADAPLPEGANSICIAGVGFPAGVGSALYHNTKVDHEPHRYAGVTLYRESICGRGNPVYPPVQARQVGQAGQAASRTRLQSEVALMIGNVRASWQKRIDADARRASQGLSVNTLRRPRPIPLDVKKFTADTKAALQSCIDLFKDEPFKNLRAAAERELARFDEKRTGGGGRPPANQAIPPK